MMFALSAIGLVSIVHLKKNPMTTMTRIDMKSGLHRERMPKKRVSRVHEFNVSGHMITIVIGEYEDGSVGEVFIDLGKEGSDVSGWANAFAICLSLGLQHGVPLDKFCHTFKDMKFGFHDDEVTSVPDLVMKTLEREYCNQS
jgi:ribonucleoside-diphosphate reductase alpha chain